MPRTPLLLLVVASAASARTPPPAPVDVVVSDREAARVLSSEYEHETARIKGDWKAAGDAASTRRVCADSGAQPRERRIAVCTSPAATNPGGASRIDLFVIRAGATRRDPAELRTRFRGIDARGVDAKSGDVGFLALGPADTGFVITRHNPNATPQRAIQSLYAEVAGELREMLAVTSVVTNRGACTPMTSRHCSKRLLELECTLQANASHIDNGFYLLQLQVTGTRRGDIVERTIDIPRDAYGYRVSARDLKSRGCDATE
ncbi:hypothetical protein [Lysobacter claricitrinus]|uniref:hypothetical protein n=1 Tax=Lysobacter claricitrinus TaxID=3367728 RepID=UPI0037DA9760